MASVLPGYTWLGTTDPITFAKLNLTANPTVVIGAGEIVPSNMSNSGIGYATGAGSTTVQLTSKATAFTLNNATGQITTAGDILNAGTIVSATWNNSLIAAADVVIVAHKSGGTIGAYTFNVSCGTGTATLYIRNATAGNLTETLVLSYVLIKGATS